VSICHCFSIATMRQGGEDPMELELLIGRVAVLSSGYQPGPEWG
jgi:hypothetical protein